MKPTTLLESQVKKTLKEIKLKKSDKILVAVSGGKDSAVVAYILKQLKYNVEAIHINLGIPKYSEACLKSVRQLCKITNIKLNTYYLKKEIGKSMLQIFKNNKNKKLSNCTMCGVFKKYFLNKKSRKLKAKYIATGHHLDDEAQTFLMNIMKGSPKLSANTGAITKNISDKKFISRIKPLYHITEKQIIQYSKKHKLPEVKTICPYRGETYRIEIRKFINTLPEKNKKNILNNFKKVYPKIEKAKDSKIQYCEICGEPARNKICKKCSLIN